jgi:hypothetical protein
MATRTIDGRLAIDRAGVAERWHVSLPTLDRRLAEHTPPPVIPGAAVNRRQKWWWWLDEIDTWMQGFEDRKRAALTHVDRTGDPGDLLNSGDAARVLGYRGSGNLRPEFLGLADQVDELPSGAKRRWWRRSTIWAYADARSGKGGSGGRVGNANPLGPARRRIDRTGAPDDLLTSREAAAVLGYVRVVSLPKSLLALADEKVALPSGRVRRRWRRATLWAFADQQTAERGDVTSDQRDPPG